MADEDDSIRVDLKSDVSDGEKARRKLQDLEQQADELRSSFERGNVTLERYNKELRSLESQANKARSALDKIDPGKLTGAKRASAKFQVGLAAANTAQDVIQGGPAAGINNILGLAGNNSARALGGEMIAAAGGIATVGAAFAGVAVAAGAAFLAIDHGLKQAKLEWSDLDDVVANTHAWRALEETASGALAILKDAGIAEPLKSAAEAAFPAISLIGQAVDKYAIGWDQATEAARRQREEVERGLATAREYAEAVKSLAKVQSAEQKEGADKGKAAVDQIAQLGGKGGLQAVLGKLADKETAHSGKDANGKDRMVPDGNGGEITRREQAKRRLELDAYRASQGDEQALGRLKQSLKAGGFDTRSITGVSPKEAAKKDDEVREAEEAAARDAEHYDRELKAQDAKRARPLQKRFNLLSASGQAPDEAGVRRQLGHAGMSASEVDIHAPGVLKSLQEGYKAQLAERAGEKGLTPEGAAKDLLDEHNKDFAEKQKQAREKKKREAIEKAEKATAGSAFDERGQSAMMRNALASGGLNKAAFDQTKAQMKREMMGRGQSAEDADLAAQDKAEKLFGKLGDEITSKAMKGPELHDVRRIGASEFAASVEGSDNKKMLDVTEQVKEQLVELVRLTGRGPRMGP